MDNIQEMYKARNNNSMSLIKDAFNFRNTDDVPFVFNTANYFSFGYSPEEIPDDYYTNPASMYKRQVEQFTNHFSLPIEDNYVPYLMPWYGTGVTASAFGVEINFLPKMDPTTEGIGLLEDVNDIDKLEIPDFSKDGLMPKVIETIRYFQENSNIPVGFTDNHGPLTLAVQIVGYEKLFFWMYDYPKKVHQLMDLLSETVIGWVNYQKKLLGEPLNHCFGNQGIYVPEGVGVWFSDDDSVIISSDLYKEFVVPYNEKILRYFDGGIIHFCGNGNQHIDNFLSMKYLRGINNFALGEWESLLKLKQGLEDRVVIIACDFTHADYTDYYKKLFIDNNMSKKGLVIQSLFSPIVGARDGKYDSIDRDERKVAADLDKIIIEYFRK